VIARYPTQMADQSAARAPTRRHPVTTASTAATALMAALSKNSSGRVRARVRAANAGGSRRAEVVPAEPVVGSQELAPPCCCFGVETNESLVPHEVERQVAGGETAMRGTLEGKGNGHFEDGEAPQNAP
jgi:hypothetical protein